MQKATLISISEQTGFSISTVSRVLSGQAKKYRISEQTVNIIKSEAKRSNYTPSLLAKGLRTKCTNTIGLIIPSIENPYFANIASVIIQEAKCHGIKVFVFDTFENEINEREGVLSMVSQNVDGIVVVPCGQDPAQLERINADTPVVLIDRCFAETKIPFVCTDNYLGGLIGTRHLLDKGHRRIACIQGTPHSVTVKERVRGYLDALRERGLEEEAMISGVNFSIQNGYLETKLILTDMAPPTAIFALSNTILLGAVKALREASIRVPDQMSVMCFDNNTYLEFLDPAITCISQPIEEIGTLAVKILMNRISGKMQMPDAKILLPPRLLVRYSVAGNPGESVVKPIGRG